MPTATKSAALQRQMSHLMSISDMRKRFKTKGSKIHYWRRKKGLPAVVIPGDPYPVVRFVPSEVEAWDKMRLKHKQQ